MECKLSILLQPRIIGPYEQCRCDWQQSNKSSLGKFKKCDLNLLLTASHTLLIHTAMQRTERSFR